MCHISVGYKTDFNAFDTDVTFFDAPYLNILLFEYTTSLEVGLFFFALVTKAAFIWYKIKTAILWNITYITILWNIITHYYYISENLTHACDCKAVICSFGAQKHFYIIINVENSYAA